MNKEGTPIRYDLYKAPHTPRLPAIFIESFDAIDTTALFKLATRTFHFDRTKMLQFVQGHVFDKAIITSKSHAVIVKVFSDCSPQQRIQTETMRINGIYGDKLTDKQIKEKEYYQSELDKLLTLTNAIAK